MELDLQLSLGVALRTSRGFGHPDTGRAYARARQLCEDLGETPRLFPVLFGLWEFHQNQGELTGVSTGFRELDKMTAGLQPGDLVIVNIWAGPTRS